MRFLVLAFAASIASLGGCATGLQASQSGFLQDYSALRPNPTEPERLSFRAEDAQWSQYRSFIVEPVEVRAGDLSTADSQALAQALRQSLSESFAQERRATDVVGPDTLRIRAAVTEVVHPNRALNLVTSLALGPVSRGAAAGEAEIVDGRTGRRLAAISWAGDGGIAETLGFYTNTGHARAALRRFADETAALARPD